MKKPSFAFIHMASSQLSQSAPEECKHDSHYLTVTFWCGKIWLNLGPSPMGHWFRQFFKPVSKIYESELHCLHSGIHPSNRDLVRLLLCRAVLTLQFSPFLNPYTSKTSTEIIVKLNSANRKMRIRKTLLRHFSFYLLSLSRWILSFSLSIMAWIF